MNRKKCGLDYNTDPDFDPNAIFLNGILGVSSVISVLGNFCPPSAFNDMMSPMPPP